MNRYVLSVIIQRILLPIILVSCIFMRPVGLSLPYFLALLFVPFSSTPTKYNISHKGGYIFKFLISTSIINILIQIAIQVFVFVYDDQMTKCEDNWEYILRHVGLVQFRNLEIKYIIYWISFDVAIFITSFMFLLSLKKLFESTKKPSKRSRKKEIFDTKTVLVLMKIGIFFSLLLMCLAGIVQPSVFNISYFISYMCIVSWWGLNQNFRRSFGKILLMISIYGAFHLICILLYQNPWPQYYLEEYPYIRDILGLKAILLTNCGKNFSGADEDFRKINFNLNHNLDVYLNPLVLVLCYIVNATTASTMLCEKYDNFEDADNQQNKRMSQNVWQFTKKHLNKFKLSISIVSKSTDAEVSDDDEPENKKSRIFKFLQSVYNFIYEYSFIASHISMMAWSIYYHSWFGFVFLMWSNFIWTLPNQKAFMLKSSPILICYAESLLVLTYFFSMEFIKNIPISVLGVNLYQIGIRKTAMSPLFELAPKSFFTFIFLCTRRIMLQQKEAQLLKTLEDDAKSEGAQSQTTTTSSRTTSFRNIIKRVFIFTWIWVTVLSLFAYNFIGNKISLFKVIYMFLFLAFNISFQISFYVWRKLLKLFWNFVIFYSMIVLTLIYSYQFDEFPNLWHKFLGIPMEIQSDIGLTKMKTTELLNRMVVTSLIIILTGIQINYFHDKFLKLTLEAYKERISIDSTDSRFSTYTVINIKLPDSSRKCVEWVEKILLYLELHFIKFLFVLAFVVAVQNAHIIQIPLVVLSIVGLYFYNNSMKRIILRIISICASLTLLATMIFKMNSFDVYRNNWYFINFIVTFIGNAKSGELYVSAIYQMLLVFSITLYLLLFRRQAFNRSLYNEENAILFPDISRRHADKDVNSLIKYIFNYGFYKFGIEICLIFIAIIISLREDIFSMWYSVILLTFLILPHNKFWFLRILMVVASIVFQYLMHLISTIEGMEPRSIESFLQNVWKFSTHNIKENFNVTQIEYVLLVMMFCQGNVLLIEEGYRDSYYPGGINKLDVNKSGRPKVPDFINQKSLLNVIKRTFFSVFIWIALTMVFVTGTARVDIFSIGYIAGSFTFFWQGQNFYEKPLKTIIKWWNSLIIYNILVMLLKLKLSFWSCYIHTQFPRWYCILIQMLKVDCFHITANLQFPKCILHDKNMELYLDCISFCLLILQKRIFYSDYFSYIVVETKATNLLASRGIELIDELLMDKIKDEEARETRTVGKLISKMERMKKTEWMKKQKKYKMEYHHEVILSGDYEMFEEDEDEAENTLKSEISELKVEPDTDLLLTAITSVIESTDKKVSRDPSTAAESIEIEDVRRLSIREKFVQGSTKFRRLSKALIAFTAERLHKISRNYFYVLQVLYEEKKLLKNSPEFSLYESLDFRNDFDPSISKNKMLKRISLLNRESQLNIMTQIDENFIQGTSHLQEDQGDPKKSVFYDLFIGLFYVFLSYSDVTCYCMIFFNQITEANMMNLMLPLIIFFWSVMSIPRPSKTFWVCMMSYVQTLIIIKLISRFSMLWWNAKNDQFDPARLPELLGIESDDGYNTNDLILLILIFLHRLILKHFGLWNEFSISQVPSGSYYVVDADRKTKKLLEFNRSTSNTTLEETLTSDLFQQNTDETSIDTDDQSLIIRHEFKKPRDQWSTARIETLKQTEKTVIMASYDVSSDYNEITVNLKQDHVDLTLREIDPSNESRMSAFNQIIIVEKTFENASQYFPSIAMLSIHKHFSYVRKFFKQLCEKKRKRRNVDVYKYTFLCDFVNFLVILFGFSSFEPQEVNRTVVSYLKENRIPRMFLFMLFVQFILIIVDRALYLRKSIKGKIIFQYISIGILHFWLFVVLPLSTEKYFRHMPAAVAYYIIKCIYFLLSAYQIRCGYPSKTCGNFLTKKYHLFNLICFFIFMNIPFLFELRAAMDWLLTDTSLSLEEWFKMETMFSNLYAIKCSRKMSDDFPILRGRKTLKSKIFMGAGLITVIVFLIWFPLVFFSVSGKIGEPNIPMQFSISISFDDYNPIYEMSTKEDNIHSMAQHYNNLMLLYTKSKHATGLLRNYEPADIVATSFASNSKSIWSISPPDESQFIYDIENDFTVTCRITFKIYRRKPDGIEQQIYYKNYKLPSSHESPIRKELIEVLVGSRTSVTIPKMLPKFFKVQNIGILEPAHSLTSRLAYNSSIFRDIRLKFEKYRYSYWWNVGEICNDTEHEKFFKFVPQNDCHNRFTIYLLNDQFFASAVGIFMSRGIIGLYGTVIFVLSRFFRNILTSKSLAEIMFTHLPTVERLLQICRDLYLAREAREFEMEEELFAKLIFLHRSPETLIKVCKPKVD